MNNMSNLKTKFLSLFLAVSLVITMMPINIFATTMNEVDNTSSEDSMIIESGECGENGDNKIELLFNPMNSIDINKKEPVFLVVEALQSTGTSVEICINEIKNKYKDAKILYVCLAKQYESRNFKERILYEDFAFYYNGSNKFSKDKCKELNIEYYHPLFPWENLEIELKHPDDLEENIFF